MYFKGKEGCPAGGLLCKSKTDFHKAKQVHSVCRSRRLCRLAGSSGFFRKPKANPYALPNTFVGADAHIGPAERTVFTVIPGEFATFFGPTESSAPTSRFHPPARCRGGRLCPPAGYTDFTGIFGEFVCTKAPLGHKGSCQRS